MTRKTARPTGESRAPRRKRGAAAQPPARPAPPVQGVRWESLTNGELESLTHDGIPGYDPRTLGEGCWFDHAAARRALGWFPDMCRHVEGHLAGKRFYLQRWQASIVACLFGFKRQDGTRRYRECLLYVAKKNGKALALDTPIPTPTGWTTMGQVSPGDLVYDENGQPTRVVAATDRMYGHRCYRVVFSDGTSIVADAEHQWVTRSLLENGAERVRTTEEIRSTLSTRSDGARNHSIQVAGPILGCHASLPVAPYTLGAWLGDGSSQSAAITCGDADRQILDEVVAEGYLLGKDRRKGSSACATVGVRSVTGMRDSLQAKLRRLGVLGAKHIPQVYLRASIEQRRALLQGLMDTDGYASRAGQCEFTTTREPLWRGFLELVRSLGYKPSTKAGRATLHGRDVGPKWRVQFWARRGDSCFRLDRKTRRLRLPPPRAPRSRSRQIVAVDEVASVPVRCIAVDSPSHLYLAGEGFVPTHNTAFAAALALYMLAADGEGGAKVLCAASARDQAALVFEPCAGMVRQNQRLAAHVRVYGDKGGAQRRSIVVRRDPTASLLVLSADEDTADGKNPHCSLVDEVHRHVSPKLASVLHKSSASRRQPLTVYMTTADVDRPSFCNELLRRAKAVRDNPGDPLRPGFEPAFLPVIYEADERDDWRSPATWAKANPNLGVSVQESFLREEAAKAVRSQSDLADFLRFHCNVRVGAISGWLSMPDWDQCGPEEVRGPAPDPVLLAAAYQKLVNALRGKRCFGGLDLASTDDLTAFVLWFPEQAAALSWFWVPEVSARQREERHHVPYAEWRRCGWVEATPGNACDYDFVVSRVAQLAREYSIETVAFDRWGAAKHVQGMQSDGLNVLAFGQGFVSMSPPAKEVEIAVKKHRLNHGGHPVLRWNAGNAVVRRDPAGLIKPDKARSFEKIDGLVALVMAYGASMMGAPPSVYESRGPIII